MSAIDDIRKRADEYEKQTRAVDVYDHEDSEMKLILQARVLNLVADIRTLLDMLRWIPVSERQPTIEDRKGRDYFLVTRQGTWNSGNKYRYVVPACYFDEWVSYDATDDGDPVQHLNDVTHWMIPPLPAAPEDGHE